MLCALIAAPALAQHAPAGTRIANTARLVEATGSIDSNTVTLTVETLVDVAVTAQRPALRVTGAAAATIVAFDVVDTGNATERFSLGASGDGSMFVVRASPDATDAIAAIDLAPGQQRTDYVTVPLESSARQVTLTATAATGHGAPGTVYPGAGAGGTDAVLGSNGASASATTALLRDGADATLVKSASVRAPDGSTRAMPGSIITYRLDASAAAPVRDAAIVDPLPAGTDFVPGSILLDDQPQADAAAFDGTTVRVPLGDLAAGVVRSVRFQVRIR